MSALEDAESAYFEVHEAFRIQARNLFVLAGRIVHGTLRAGLMASFADRDNAFEAPVHSVEYADRGATGDSMVALTFLIPEGSVERDVFESLPFRGATLQLCEVKRYACPCCGYFTLHEKAPGTYDICAVCNWEDDPVQYEDPEYEGGANQLSLNAAKRNYMELGVSDPRFRRNVRPPRPEERL